MDYIVAVTAVVGSMFHMSTTFRLIVDGVVVCSDLSTPMAAFGVLFGMYFLLNISYPSAVGATMEYVQRYVCIDYTITYIISVSAVEPVVITVKLPSTDIILLDNDKFAKNPSFQTA